MLHVSKKRAKAIIQFIKEFKLENGGFTPSVLEVSRGIGLTYGKTHTCLKNLANNNYIVYTGRNAVWISSYNKTLEEMT